MSRPRLNAKLEGVSIGQVSANLLACHAQRQHSQFSGSFYIVKGGFLSVALG